MPISGIFNLECQYTIGPTTSCIITIIIVIIIIIIIIIIIVITIIIIIIIICYLSKFGTPTIRYFENTMLKYQRFQPIKSPNFFW